jgi:hypothetical protein
MTSLRRFVMKIPSKSVAVHYSKEPPSRDEEKETKNKALLSFNRKDQIKLVGLFMDETSRLPKMLHEVESPRRDTFSMLTNTKWGPTWGGLSGIVDFARKKDETTVSELAEKATLCDFEACLDFGVDPIALYHYYAKHHLFSLNAYSARKSAMEASEAFKLAVEVANASLESDLQEPNALYRYAVDGCSGAGSWPPFVEKAELYNKENIISTYQRGAFSS